MRRSCMVRPSWRTRNRCPFPEALQVHDGPSLFVGRTLRVPRGRGIPVCARKPGCGIVAGVLGSQGLVPAGRWSVPRYQGVRCRCRWWRLLCSLSGGRAVGGAAGPFSWARGTGHGCGSDGTGSVLVGPSVVGSICCQPGRRTVPGGDARWRLRASMAGAPFVVAICVRARPAVSGDGGFHPLPDGLTGDGVLLDQSLACPCLVLGGSFVARWSVAGRVVATPRRTIVSEQICGTVCRNCRGSR